MNSNNNSRMHLQIYANAGLGIRYLKTIGIFDKDNEELILNWRDLKLEMNDNGAASMVNLNLFLDGQRVHLTGWTDALKSGDESILLMSNPSFIYE
jgi:hypothetical protein